MDNDSKYACEVIDAALFSSDLFHRYDYIQELEEYIERWKRQIGQIRLGLKSEPEEEDHDNDA